VHSRAKVTIGSLQEVVYEKLTLTLAISYLWSLGTNSLSLTVSEILNSKCNAVVKIISTIASHVLLNISQIVKR